MKGNEGGGNWQCDTPPQRKPWKPQVSAASGTDLRRGGGREGNEGRIDDSVGGVESVVCVRPINAGARAL